MAKDGRGDSRGPRMGSGGSGRAVRSRDEDEGTAPWLDEADYDEGRVHTLVGRRMLLTLVLVVLLMTIGIVIGVSIVSKRMDTPIDVPPPGAEVPVLTTPGPWKTKPTGPGLDGVPIEGQGQMLYGTSEGLSTDSRINLDALPEEPLPRPGTIKETDAGTEVEREEMPAAEKHAAKPAPKPEAAARPEPATKPEPASGPKTITAPSGSGLVQLGAFSSEGRARSAFQALTGRFSYLRGLEPLILPVAQNGKTLYRLRARVADKASARDICGRLSVAGEACSVVNQN